MNYRRGIIPTLHRLVAYIGIAVSALVVLMACTSEGSTTAPQQTSSPQPESTRVMESTSAPSSTTEATDAPSPTPSAVSIDTPRPTSTPESIVDSFDCNDQRFIDEIVQLSEENENPSAPRILKMYVDAVEEIERTDKLLRCRTEVRLSTDQERYATYHLEIDRDGDAFIGYRLGDVTSVPTPLSTAAPANTPNPSRPAGVGDTVRLQYVELTLNSVRSSYGNGTYVPRLGNHFVHLNVTVRNVSGAPTEVFYLLGGEIQDVEDKIYEPATEAIPEVDGWITHFVALGTGQSLNAVSHFELPRDVTGLTWRVFEESLLTWAGISQEETVFYLGTVDSSFSPPGRSVDNLVNIGDAIVVADGTPVRVSNVLNDAQSQELSEPKHGYRFLMVSVEEESIQIDWSTREKPNVSSLTREEFESYLAYKRDPEGYAANAGWNTRINPSKIIIIDDDYRIYTQSEDNCGAIPDLLKSRGFNVCFQIPEGEAEPILIYNPYPGGDPEYGAGTYRYFSLKE